LGPRRIKAPPPQRFFPHFVDFIFLSALQPLFWIGAFAPYLVSFVSGKVNFKVHQQPKPLGFPFWLAGRADPLAVCVEF